MSERRFVVWLMGIGMHPWIQQGDETSDPIVARHALHAVEIRCSTYPFMRWRYHNDELLLRVAEVVDDAPAKPAVFRNFRVFRVYAQGHQEDPHISAHELSPLEARA